MKRKKLPNKKHKGLFIYCSKCKKYFSYTKKVESNNIVQPKCGKSGKNYSSCEYPEKQKYKVRVHVPGTIKDTTGKTLFARTYEEAVVEAVEFSNKIEDRLSRPLFGRREEESRRIYLIAAQVKYVDYLADVGVPDHKKRNRSESNIKEHIRSLKYFNNILDKQNINTRLLPVDMIGDIHVGYFHKYLVSHFGNVSYNKHMGYLRYFFKWIINNYNPNLKNPFEVKRKPSNSVIATITKKEFNDLLNIITPERGMYISETAKKKTKRNFYAPFLKVGFLIALHTGGRREEIACLKWNMIREKEGKPIYIEVANLKVERIKKLEGEGKVAPKIIPITNGLLEILQNYGYSEKKGSNEYIVCPDRSKYSSKTIMEKLSKGFSHYYKLLETDRQLQFKCLRKTYLTYLKQVIKGDTKSLSSHASDQILQKHYIDERVVSKAIQEVRIFD